MLEPPFNFFPLLEKNSAGRGAEGFAVFSLIGICCLTPERLGKHGYFRSWKLIPIDLMEYLS